MNLALEVDLLRGLWISCDVNGRLVSTLVRLSNGWHEFDKIRKFHHEILVPVHNLVIAMLYQP